MFQILRSFWFPPAHFGAVWHENDLSPTGAPAMGIDNYKHMQLAIGKTNFSRSTRGPIISSICVSTCHAHANELGQLGKSTLRIILSHPAQATQAPDFAGRLCLYLDFFTWSWYLPSPRSSRIECIYISHMLRTPWAAKPSFQQGMKINDQRLFRGPVTRPFPISFHVWANKLEAKQIDKLAWRLAHFISTTRPWL